jgi:hypothetical protein
LQSVPPLRVDPKSRRLRAELTPRRRNHAAADFVSALAIRSRNSIEMGRRPNDMELKNLIGVVVKSTPRLSRSEARQSTSCTRMEAWEHVDPPRRKILNRCVTRSKIEHLESRLRCAAVAGHETGDRRRRMR